MKYIYLAGPLTAQSFDQSNTWRKLVQQSLPDHIRTLSPLRGLEHLNEEADLKHTYANHPLTTAKGLTMKDYNDVDRSDALLVNFLGATKVSIGTVMEISRAAAKSIPVICVMEEDNLHRHPILNQACGVIITSLEEGIEMIVSILSDDLEMESYLYEKEQKINAEEALKAFKASIDNWSMSGSGYGILHPSGIYNFLAKPTNSCITKGVSRIQKYKN